MKEVVKVFASKNDANNALDLEDKKRKSVKNYNILIEGFLLVEVWR